MRPSVAVLALLVLAGCQSGPKRRQIAVVPKATSHVFWITVQSGALAAGRDLGVDVLWNGPPAETEYSRQIQIVDSMVARRVDAIAVAAAEEKALTQPVERAMAAGIPVLVFDSGLASENYVSFLATNNYEGGVMAARELARLVDGAGDVALLMHMPGSRSSMDRERGFEETLQKEFPKIRIVARQFGQSDRAKARAAAENMLAAHPQLKGMFASTEPSSVGAALAIKSRELTGKVRLVAFDNSDVMIEDLRGGTIDAMVVQDAYKIGYESVRHLVEKLDGNELPKRIDLSARLVRKGDLENPEVRQLLFPDLRKN